MHKFKKILLILGLLLIFVSFSIFLYANNISNSLYKNIFRLHIIANSNSFEDQSLKLKIRDNIIAYLEKTCENCNTKEDYINTINKNTNTLKTIIQKTIVENNFNYSSNIEIGKYFFPTKHYANISLPSGYYDGIKIEIGDAKGQNWWCSLFPPLCFADISSGVLENEDSQLLENNISTEEFNLITKKNSTYIIKFKLIEFLNEKNIL